MKAPFLLLVAALAVSPLAAETRSAIASPHATLRELGLVQRVATFRVEAHEQRRSFEAPISSSSTNTVRAQSIVTKPSIAAPPVKTGFAASVEGGYIPSDATGAVSGSYVLQATNSTVMVQDRTGTVISRISLASFWHDPAFTDGLVYDPRVLYDAVADRWIICSIYDLNYKKSTLLLAVSDGPNPTLGWRRYRFLVDPRDVLEADYTRMAMTRDAIVCAANIYNGGQLSNAFVFRKSDLYAGQASVPVTQVPLGFYDLVPVDGRDDPTPYFILRFSLTDLTIYSLNGSQFTTLGHPGMPSTPGVTVIYGPADRAIGAQLGSPQKIDCGYDFASEAIMKNGVLWVVSQPYLANPVRSSVLWWKITMGTSLSVDTGLIDDPSGATIYAFPSIAVNKAGASLIGYSMFNASTYPSAGYTYIDPLNHMSTVGVMIAGVGPADDSRWADYSSTVVDTNDLDFWTTQTYVSTTTIRTPHWATWWSKIEMPAPARRHAAR